MNRWALLVLLGSFCAAGLLGCAGSGPAPSNATPSASGSPSSFDALQRGIFDVKCLSAGCHNAADGQGGLVLEAGRSFAALVGIPPSNAVARTAGLLRVDPGHPERSFLITKLTGSAPGEGSPMPLGAPPLSTADIQRVRAWISAGAPGPNQPPNPSATETPSFTPVAVATATATASPTSSATATITGPPTATPTGTRPATPRVTLTAPPSVTPRATRTPTGTATPSASATASVVPTPTFSVDATLPQIQATIFSPTCLDLGCHNAADAQGGLVLEVGRSFGDLVGAPPANAVARTAGFLRVDPGHPENSFLITKLTLPTFVDVNFGSRMPLAKPMLDPQQIERLRAWILRGALENEFPP